MTNKGLNGDQKPSIPPKTLAEKLHDTLIARFGLDWKSDLGVRLRVDKLYWIVYLAEKGLVAERQARKGADGKLSVIDACSCGSWELDLEEFVKNIEEAPVIKPIKHKKE